MASMSLPDPVLRRPEPARVDSRALERALRERAGGEVRFDLNAKLAPLQLMFGPKPSTHDHYTPGGMIGNKSCGATARAYAKTVGNVIRLEVLTYDGERVLLPAVRDAPAECLVLADGFSCRTQIEQSGVGRTPVHLAEVLAAGLRGQPVRSDHVQ